MADEQTSAQEQQAVTASPKEKFTLLLEMLKFYYGSPLDGLVRTSAILVVIAGWMASSESVQRQLCLNPKLRWWGLALIVVGEMIYLYIAWRVYFRSKATFELLKEVAYMEDRYYANYRIPGHVIAAYCLASILVAASAGTLVLMVEPKPATSNSTGITNKSSVDTTCPGFLNGRRESPGQVAPNALGRADV